MNPYDRRLKSGPVPVLFIPFKNNEEKCNYCGTEYAKTLEFEQKYCKNCLFWYIKYEGGNITCLKKYVITKKTQCIEHKAARNSLCATDTQEWSENDCPEILYFTHLIPNTSSLNNFIRSSSSKTFDNNGNIIEEGLSFYLSEHGQKYSYKISSEWIESILTKKPIQILNLTWWDNFDKCVVCLQELKYIHQESASHYQKWCQKWCPQCFIIYTGCRYCLTTNIIFGIANQSRCQKCKSISLINIDTTNIASENYIIDDFILIFKRDDTILNSLRLIRYLYSDMVNYLIEQIPYSQFKDLRKIGEGGFSIIYKATWSDGIKDTDVALKKLSNSQNISKYFFNELRSLSQCNGSFYVELAKYSLLYNDVIHCHGITQDPATKEYMMIMDYADGGDLHNYLQKNFRKITWNEKWNILRKILHGLFNIHLNNLIHRDLHSGNVLLKSKNYWKIGDFGLSQPANNTSSNNEIYGVIPYIAPEIFKGGTFSKKSDIYSLGMIMWELTTGCKPFANVEHNVDLIYEIIDGKRPEITYDTPEYLANLIKQCWDSDPSRRPDINVVRDDFIFHWPRTSEILERAENKRLELIQLKELGPEFSEKSNPKAIYTSRALSSLISKTSISSSINSLGYIIKEYELDINKIQSSSIHTCSHVTKSQHQNVSGPLNNLISTVTVNSSRKRSIEELNIETQKSKKNKKNNDADNLDEELC